MTVKLFTFSHDDGTSWRVWVEESEISLALQRGRLDVASPGGGLATLTVRGDLKRRRVHVVTPVPR